MGVQYQDAIAARSDARFSTTSGFQREPDLVLQPCKEGVDFTLRLIQANRMCKVVEIQCDFDGEEKKGTSSKQLTEEDVTKLFQAIGGSEEEDEEDEVNEDHVAEEYQQTDSSIYCGLPHLESLSIKGNDSTPSFLEALISFLTASGSFPRFTRLSLQGVNLRGGLLELKALAEAFRLHPHLQSVHMVGCWFTPEQQANMDCLQSVFQEQEQRRSSTVDSQRASIQHMRQLVLEHAGDCQEPVAKTTTTNNAPNKPKEVDGSASGEGSWLEKLLKSCFCLW